MGVVSEIWKGFGILFKFKHLLIIPLILVLLTGVVQGEDFLPLNKIKPGMQGIAKTVFQGTRVEEFNVEVISIMKNQGLNDRLILVKTSGERIEQIGGIASGMSGSPVYIDDKLIGAIGYGWNNGSNLYGLVTPIGDMLQLISEENKITDTNINSKSLSGLGENIVRLQAPLVVNGLTGRALKNLKEDFSEYDFKILPAAQTKKENKRVRLKPGSAVAVQLVTGDINVSSIGTLTYIDDNQIIAFGHPFTNRGKVNYLLSKAYINAIIPSQQQPFKLGAPLDKPVGIIKTDRGAGIAGNLKDVAEIIPMNILITDKDRKISKKVKVQIIKDELFLTTLGTNVALQAVDSVLDRRGEGTAWTKITVMGNGLPDFEIKRENMYYSKSDIAARSIQDLYQILDMIAANPFKKVNIMNITLDIAVARKDNIALVKEAKILNEEVRPGDTLDIEVTLQPYRSHSFVKKISLKLPEDIKPGMSNISIRGGYMGQMNQPPDYQQQDTGKGEYEVKETQINGYKSFSEMINSYLKQPKNNELIIQVFPGYGGAAVPAMAEGEKDKKKNPTDQSVKGNQTHKNINDKEPPEIKKALHTNYILEGNLSLNIKIKEKNDKQEEKKDDTHSTGNQKINENK